MQHEREAKREELRARLLAGSSLLMTAPRRVGKTWLLQRMREDMANAGWQCVFIDLEGMRSEDEFLRALCVQIERTQDVKVRLLAHLTQRFQQVAMDAGGSLQQAIGKVDARGLLEALVEALDREKRNTLVLIDEVALFILEQATLDTASARSLLYLMRKLKQNHPRVRWFLTGSIGLDVVCRRFNMAGALLDYDEIGLDPFILDEARSYVTHLQTTGVVWRSFNFANGAFERLAEQLGWLSPYYLRQIVQRVVPTGAAHSNVEVPTATADDVDRAIDDILASHTTHFAGWEEHIVKNFAPEDEVLLRAILAILCETADGEQEATIQARLAGKEHIVDTRKIRNLLNALAADAYIERRGNRWTFRSGLLRRFWIEHVA